MSEQPKELLYLDTSVHVVRLLKGPTMRGRVEQRASAYLRSSGLVSRQEFKRRIIRDAIYLLGELDKRRGYEDAFDHIERLHQLPHHKRRASTCLALLKRATGNSDKEKFDSLRVRLRTFILTALSQFDGWLDAPNYGPSGCGCGRGDVRVQKHPRKGGESYDAGENECSRLADGRCGVVGFLVSRKDDREKIAAYLRSLSPEEKTAEIIATEQFLKQIEPDAAAAPDKNPCSKVGDFLIALESVAAKAGVIYTMNWKESRHFCRALEQSLIVRPPDALNEDVVCARGDAENWLYFKSTSQETKTAPDSLPAVPTQTVTA